MSISKAKIHSLCIDFEVNNTSIIYYFITYCNKLDLNVALNLAHFKQNTKAKCNISSEESIRLIIFQDIFVKQ